MPTALIIIRLWHGDDRPDELRARMVIKVDLTADVTEYATASTVEELTAEVGTWAATFLARPG